MATAVVVGSTGLVGHSILNLSIKNPAFSNVQAFARRELPVQSDKLTSIISTDSFQWPTQFPKVSDPSSTVFFSGLATTKKQAGSFENQYKIDHDLNVSLAKVAKEAGVRTYVLISGAGPNSKSMFPYIRMKGELEERITEIGFDHTVFVRPGMIVGDRNQPGSRPVEFPFEWGLMKIASGAGKVANGMKDFWAQDSEVIAKAAVAAGIQCQEGKCDKKVWVLGASDIVRLGRTEWKE